MGDTALRSSPKRGFKFWKKNKRTKIKSLSSESNIVEGISDTNSSISETQACIPSSTKGRLDETTLQTPERNKISSQQNKNKKNAAFNNDQQDIINYQDAKTPPFKNITYPEKINSVSIPPPPPPQPLPLPLALLPQYQNTTPEPRQVITEEKKRMCLEHLYTIAKTHGVYAQLDKSSKSSSSCNIDRIQSGGVIDATGRLIPVTDKASKENNVIDVTGQSIPVTDKAYKENELRNKPFEENASQVKHRHNIFTSPKSVMEDISNQISTIWKESNISNVLSCASDVNFIHDVKKDLCSTDVDLIRDIKNDLCFCPEVDFNFDWDGFDGDVIIYERYMDMKRRSRLANEDDSYSASDNDGQYSYSDNRSRKRERRRGRSRTIRRREPEQVADTKFDTHSSSVRLYSPETINERLNVIGNVEGGSSDDNLEKMMKQLDLNKANSSYKVTNNSPQNHNDMNMTIITQSSRKSSSIASNRSRKNRNDRNMPSRAQSNIIPWDESFNVYQDVPDGNIPKSSSIAGNHSAQNHNEMNMTIKTQRSSISKSSSIASNHSYKNHYDMNIPSRPQSSSIPWDEGSYVYEDVPDDEKGFQWQSSRRNIFKDKSVRDLHRCVETEVIV